MIPLLPPYIYQMIDHLYISDTRGFVYHDFFDMVINTTQLHNTNSGTIDKHQLTEKTIQLTIRVQPITTIHIVEDLCNELVQTTQNHKKILLYADSYDASALVVYTYLTTRYHFTKDDIRRMIMTRPYSNGLTLAFQMILK